MYLCLYADRMEFPRWRGRPRLVIWSEMKAIRWPESRNSEAKIEIAVPKSTDWPLAKAALDLQSLSPEDRLLLIRYLRLHVADKEEAGWPQFCQKRAVPLVEALKKRETDDGASERPLAGEFLNRHLFLTGLLSPLLFARFVVREVSREMWWTTAGLIALSGVVNIRLAWGRWVSPFTEVVMGAAAAMVIIGLFSRSMGRDKPNEISWLSAATSLTAAFVGFPLLGNAVVQGWLKIPRQVLGWTGYAALLVLLWPALAYRFRTLRREKQQAPALEADALRRWDTYIETGELPPPADAPVT